MDAAEARLGEVGYLGVSLEEVARDVGVSKPALYYHFPGGKEEIFVALAHRVLKLAREGLERATSGQRSAADKLHAVAGVMMEMHHSGRPMVQLRDVVKFVAERHQVELAQGFYAALFGPIRRTMAEGVESGEFRDNDPDFLAWSFLGLALGTMDVGDGPDLPPGFEPPGDPVTISSEEVARSMVDLFLDGALE